MLTVRIRVVSITAHNRAAALVWISKNNQASKEPHDPLSS
jgi:hypothetical protein